MKKTQINEEQIKIMSKLAVYDKTYGDADRAANDLYYRDYVYKKNFIIRLFALIGTLIPMGIYVVLMLIDDTADVLNINYLEIGMNLAMIVAAVMIVYTFIGTRIATEDYKNSKMRLKTYFGLLKQLDALKSSPKTTLDDDDEETEADERYRAYQARNYEREAQARELAMQAARPEESRERVRSTNGYDDRNTRKRD